MAEKKNVNNGTENGEQKDVQKPEGTQENGANQNAGATEEPKKEKLGWFKQHWKGLTGAVAAILTVGGASVVAYKKGKQAGIMETPMNDDGSYGPEE